MLHTMVDAPISGAFCKVGIASLTTVRVRESRVTLVSLSTARSAARPRFGFKIYRD
jgi:hypothetical protein